MPWDALIISHYKSIQRWVFGGFGDEFVFPAFVAQDLLPEGVGFGMKNHFEGGGMGHPGLALHLLLELAGTPTGVAGKNFQSLGAGITVGDFEKIIEGVANVQIRIGRASCRER